MNIFLVGFMGSGKSTLGKKIAQQLKYDFIDVDKVIEKSESKTISEIFSNKGEAYFRQLESNWLKQFKGANKIIATGGGLPCFNNNLTLLQEKGSIVFIDLPAEALADRLLQAKLHRPLIEHFKGNRDALLGYIKETLADRLPYYKQSDFTLSGLNLTGEKIKQFAELLLKSKSTKAKPENKN